MFDLKNAGERINANTAIIIAKIPPFNSLTIFAIIITDKLPIMAGKNRNANTDLPKRKSDVLENNAINGGTDKYPQSKCSPSE